MDFDLLVQLDLEEDGALFTCGLNLVPLIEDAW